MSQQHQMAMQGMGVGGPVAAPANAGTPTNPAGFAPQDIIKKLNTAIYDYLLCNEKYEAARAIKNHLPIEHADGIKQSPGQRQNQPNGIDSSMDTDSKEHVGIQRRPEDLPAPNTMSTEEGPFLQDWWCQFWELYQANRHRGKPTAISYVGAQRNLQKTRTGMMSGVDAAAAQRAYMSNGGMNVDLQRQAAMKNAGMTPQQQAQMAHMQKMRQGQGNQMPGAQMERQGSQMDMNGPHSGSPNTSGDAPSPKRQRLDGGNMQQMNQARPGQPGQMQGNQVGTPSNVPPSPAPISAHILDLLNKKNLDPSIIPPEQLQRLSAQPTNVQAKSVEVYSAAMQQQMQAAMQKQTGSNMNKGMPPNPAMGPGGAQSSPMNQQGLDGTSSEFYQNRMGMPPQNGAAVAGNQPGAAANGGNHALQDYQMQLMLLEQQNKKRLLMARQEQDSMTHPTGVPGGPNGQFAPGMSPQGSRAGDPSPNPSDMQRGTPNIKKAGLSPNGDMVGRGSPTPGMMDPNTMNPAMRGPHMVMGQNGQMMPRPPSSHPMNPMTQQQIELMRQNGGGMGMPNGNWQGPQPPQGMMQGQQPPQQGGPPGQQPNMTPRAGNMPPPPAPAANQGGTQPSSPANQPAPPTPNQTSKAKAPAKKAADKKNAAANKKGAAAATNEDANPPPTPTPPPPVTPNNPAAFNQNKNLQLPNGQPGPGQQSNQSNGQQPGAPAVQQPVMDPAPFGPDLSGGEFSNMDFANIDSGDVLDNFDFDSFLNNDDQGITFDANFAFDGEELAM